MQTTHIPYAADGRQMIGTLSVGKGVGKRPAILIAHEGPGLDDHARAVAARLAELGFIAFALDYNGGGQWLPDRAQMMARIGELSAAPGRIVALGQAGLDILLAQPEADATRVAVIGYCFGGTMALHMARAGLDLKAAVGFHSGLGTAAPAAPGAIKAKVLALIGADDPIVPAAQRDAFVAEMTAARADWQLHLYGGVQHSFTNPAADRLAMPGIAYNAAADHRAWTSMIALFHEVF